MGEPRVGDDRRDRIRGAYENALWNCDEVDRLRDALAERTAEKDRAANEAWEMTQAYVQSEGWRLELTAEVDRLRRIEALVVHRHGEDDRAATCAQCKALTDLSRGGELVEHG